jgi:hypothetical protein
MNEQQQVTHYLVPTLLLHFAAQQLTRPALEYPGLQQFAAVSAQALSTARSEVDGVSNRPFPGRLQQEVLKELLPMVLKIGTAVLNLPGSAAYKGYGSSSTQSSTSTAASTPATTALHLSAASKARIATSLVRCVCCAAHEFDSTGQLYMPTYTLGSHVLAVGQLLEAAFRQSQATGSTEVSASTLSYLCHCLTALISDPDRQYLGALTDTAGATAAENAGVTAQHAQLQLASLCCSALKAAFSAAAVPGFDLRHADASCSAVCSALVAVLGGVLNTGSGPGAGWGVEFTADLGVTWLALSGRVLLYFAAHGSHIITAEPWQQVAAAAGRVRGTGTPATAEAQGVNAPKRPRLHALQLMLMLLLPRLHRVLLMAPVRQQMSAAGYDVAGLQQQLCALEKWCDADSLGLTVQDLAALKALGLALTNLAFPCACNNPACTQLLGPVELQLVNGRSCICAGCRVARYCCRRCQSPHWKQHKPVCKAIAAAKDGTGAAQNAAAGASST